MDGAQYPLLHLWTLVWLQFPSDWNWIWHALILRVDDISKDIVLVLGSANK
jgi:hypothetical protein